MTAEGDGLDLGGRYVVHLLYLLFEVLGEIVLLFTLLEGVGDEDLLLFRLPFPGYSARFAIEFGFYFVLDQRGALEAVHIK